MLGPGEPLSVVAQERLPGQGSNLEFNCECEEKPLEDVI